MEPADNEAVYPSLAKMAKIRNKKPSNQNELTMSEDDQNS